MHAVRAAVAALMLAGAAHAQTVPAGDFHQHVFSAADIALTGPSSGLAALDADQLIPLLDAAGIGKAVLLSIAYMFGSPSRKVDDEYAKVRMENDWTAAQAGRYPGRLIAFCSFNPLRDYALTELERCAKTPGLDHGIKLHIGNSDVQLDVPAHVARLRQVFAAANAHGMAIVIHLRANIGRQRPYGAAQARIFLDQVMPAAPDVPVQVAHFAGSGPGYDDPAAQAAMSVLADAVENHDPHAANLWFDVAAIVDRDISPATAVLITKTIRQVGVSRVLYGTDSAQGANLRPRESWAAFQKLPLSPAEFAHIAANVPPYFPEP